jgi:effector-binding domain-containing protein
LAEALGGLFGDLTRIAVGDLLQTLERNTITGHLRINVGPGAGIWLARGRIVKPFWPAISGKRRRMWAQGPSIRRRGTRFGGNELCVAGVHRYNSRVGGGRTAVGRSVLNMGDRLMSEVTIADVGPQTVVGMRKRGTYAQIRPMIAQIRQYIEASGAGAAGPPTFVCHESPKEVVRANLQRNADVEVAIPVTKSVEGIDEVTCYELPGGPMVKIVHEGPYEKSAGAYKTLFTWIAEHHKKVAGPVREVYLNDPKDVAPEELRTEIYAPVA